MAITAKERVQSQFGAAASAYVTSDIHSKGESLGLLVSCVHPQPTWDVLDVATGAGHTALAFAPHVRQVLATDLTAAMLASTGQLATTRGCPNVTTRTADAEALPFADATFDLVTCRLASHHFPAAATAFGEMARVLRPGGTFGFTDNVVVAEPEAARHYNEFERLRDPSHHEVVPLGRLIGLVEETGLMIDVVHRLQKEMEFQDWADRMRVSAADKDRLLDMARTLPAALVPLLAPRWADGTLYFTLWEAVIVARKPAVRNP